MARSTPKDLSITPREARFGHSGGKSKWWLGGDPIASAYYNAMSLSFPQGEAFFIQSVRAFQDGAPPALAKEISAFVRQEVFHTREHIAFNRHVTDHGYDTKKIDKNIVALIEWARERGPLACLTTTMTLEHFTAIFAHAVLRDPAHMKDADPDSRHLWQWHSIEEIEHKGVAFDTWMHATRNWSPLKRWLERIKMMMVVTRMFAAHRTADILELLRQDGISGPKAWARLFSFAFIGPGVIREIFPIWLHYFVPGFHPWAHDDRDLITRFEKELGIGTPLATA